MHSERSVRARAFGGKRFNVIFFLLVLSPCLAVAAGGEAIWPHPLPAAQEPGAVNSDSNSVDVLLPADSKKERMQLRNRRMSSMNEKKADTRDAQNPVPVNSSVSTDASTAQPDLEHKWQSLLPFFGPGAEKRGYKLPYAIGVTSGFYSGKRDIKASNANAAIAGFTIPADGLAKIKVKSRELNWSARLDAWIFPFMSVYALGGYTRQHTDAAIRVGLIDRMRQRRGAGSKVFCLPVDLTGATYGGGITLVGGYKNYFAAFDTNYTISALRGDLIFGNRLSPDVRALLCSIRLGWRKQFGDSRLNLWIGETYWDTTNTITGTPAIPVLGTVGFSLKEGTIKPWSTHIGAHIEITQNFQFMVDMGTNFYGLFCVAPAFMYRF